MIHSVDGIQPRDLLWRLKCTRSMMTEGLLSKYVYIENISHINDVRILSLSDFYANRGGASDYGRIYMEVEKKDAV